MAVEVGVEVVLGHTATDGWVLQKVSRALLISAQPGPVGDCLHIESQSMVQSGSPSPNST